MPDRESKNEKPRQSPGPRTNDGKQRSSQNGLLHGCCSKAHRPSATALYHKGTRAFQCPGARSVVREFLRCEPNCLNWTEAQHKEYECFHRYLRQAERRFHRAFQNLERTCGRRFREAMQLQHAQERAAAIELRSAQGPAARRHTTKELACPLGGALDPGPVVREFLGSAKDAAARDQSGEELACPSGGALDTAAVLRVFSRSAQALERQKAKGNPHQCTKQTAERERPVTFSRPSDRTANAVSSANRMNPFRRPLESNGQAVLPFRDQVPQCETFKKAGEP